MEETENEEEILFKPPMSVQYRCPRLPPCRTDALRAIVCLPTWQFCKELCTEPRKVPFFKVSSSPPQGRESVQKPGWRAPWGAWGLGPDRVLGAAGQGLCTQWGNLSFSRWSGVYPS